MADIEQLDETPTEQEQQPMQSQKSQGHKPNLMPQKKCYWQRNKKENKI
jgi:hypothetical protein